MNRYAKGAIIVMMTVLVLVPIYPLIGWSFSSTWTFPRLMPNSFTADRFIAVLTTDTYVTAIYNSVVLAVTVTLLSLALGFYAAKTLGMRDFRGRRALEILMLLPALAPGIAILYGVREVFVSMGLYLSWASVVIAQTVFTLPYIIMLLIPLFRNYDADYERQAATLGISKLNTLIHVTLPSIRSGLIVACMYTFMVSWSMFLVVNFLAPVGFTTIATLLLPLIATWSSSTTVAVMTLLFILPALFVFVLSSKMLGDSAEMGRYNP
ncbi:ABC transporter permease [Methanomassiliicoccus luminyensis]|uniref:ABC transporter permease n=1 Tax=Methanomassiliicoccus luminyensis TaxID=1080712 RepID=UPI000376A4C4|nr:ABC transporter permease subunit [Methanomassiliicoccus luminyensis]